MGATSRRLASLGMAVLLLAGLSAGPSLAAPSANNQVSGDGPAARSGAGLPIWTAAARPAARLYATGRPGSDISLTARGSGPGPAGPAGQAPSGNGRSASGAGAPSDLGPAGAPGGPPSQATLTTAPDNHQLGFGGLAESNQVSPGTEPPDSTIAVGPEQVVQMTNSVLRISDRAGSPLGPVVPISTFFKLPITNPATFFDRQPRVVYDSLHGRFVATETSWDCISDPNDQAFPADFGHGYIDLAVSRTSDPTGTWDLFFWGYEDQLPSDPSIGTSTDKLAISDNLSTMAHGDGGANDGSCANATTIFGGDLLIANWADVVTHNASTLLSSEFVAIHPFQALGFRAALQEPATDPTLYTVARSYEAGPLNDVIVSTFTGTTTKNTAVNSAGSWDLTNKGVMAPFADPPPPHQPGSPATLTSGIDGLAQDAIWKAGELTWATTYPCTPTGDSSSRDCVRVSQVTTTDAFTMPAWNQDFLVARNGFDTYSPGLAVSGDGTLMVTTSQSNATGSNYPSAYAQYQRSTDSSNTISPSFQLAAGTGPESGGAWGAYSGLAPDPQIAASVWQAGPYANGASGWSTFVDRLGATAASTYVPISSIRVVDTRAGGVNGLSGLAGKFVANTARSFGVTGLGSGPDQIPDDAVAVTGNLTVTGQTSAGYVSLTPDLTNTPSSSTINFPLGDVRANNVTVPLNAQGKLAAVYKAGGGTTDLVFDVTGYFEPGTGHARYVSLPVRALDTRTGTGLPDGKPAKLVVSSPLSLQVRGVGGVPGIPAEAVAISGNLTVTGQTKAGYLAITTDPTSSPLTSSLNFPLGDVRANGFTAQLSASGQISIVYKAGGGTTDVVVDITGYFTSAGGGLAFYPLNPGRVMDTRAGVANSGLSGAFSANVARTLAIAGHWGVPADAGAITGNLTVTGQTAAGYVSMTPDPTDSPLTSTLNFPRTDVRANGLFGPLNGSGDASFVYKTGSGKVQLILDLSGYFR